MHTYSTLETLKKGCCIMGVPRKLYELWTSKWNPCRKRFTNFKLLYSRICVCMFILCSKSLKYLTIWEQILIYIQIHTKLISLIYWVEKQKLFCTCSMTFINCFPTLFSRTFLNFSYIIKRLCIYKSRLIARSIITIIWMTVERRSALFNTSCNTCKQTID